MRVAIGADHAGYPLKENLREHLRRLGHEVLDLGTHDTQPVDYPDFSKAVGSAVLNGTAERGLLIYGSGVGASVAANKLPGVSPRVFSCRTEERFSGAADMGHHAIGFWRKVITRLFRTPLLREPHRQRLNR